MTNKQIIIAVWSMLSLLVLVSILYTDYATYNAKKNAQLNAIEHDLNEAHENLEESVLTYVTAMNTLATQLSLNPNISQSELNVFGDAILKQLPHLDFLFMVKDSDIALVYPDPSKKSLYTEKLYQSFPFYNNYSGLQTLGTQVYGPGEFQNKTVLLIQSLITDLSQKRMKVFAYVNFSDLVDQISAINTTDTRLTIVDNNTNNYFYGQQQLELAGTRNIRVGNLNWTLEASPRGGWVPFKLHVQVWFLGLLFILLLIYSVMLKKNNSLLRAQSKIDKLANEKRFKNFFEQHKVCMMVLDEFNCVIDANSSALSFFGYTLRDIKKRNFLNFEKHDVMTQSVWTNNSEPKFKPEEASSATFLAQMLSSNTTNVIETQFRVSTGEVKDVEIHLTPIDHNGYEECLILFFDITHKKELDNKRMLFEQVYMHAQEGIMVTDKNKNILSVNPAFENITGYESYEVLGSQPSILSSGNHAKSFYENVFKAIQKNGEWRGEIWNKTKMGKVYPQLLSISEVKDRDNNLINYVAVFTDISEQKKTEQKLEKLAHNDALTGLPNRLMFTLHLEREIKRANRTKQSCALLFLDLDRFKVINDSLGHDYGDKLLVMVAQRLNNALRDTDLLARLGGDEYVVLITDYNTDEDIACLASKISTLLQRPFRFKDNIEANIDVSIGIAQFPKDAVTAKDLLKYSDASMYQAKRSNADKFVFYTNTISAEAENKLNIKREINQSIKQHDFELMLQPIVDLTTNKIVAAEGLLRWQHPTKGFLLPDEFVPTAEQTGSIFTITLWVMNQIYALYTQLEKSGIQIKLSFNISPLDLNNPLFYSTLAKLNDASPGISKFITIEIVETGLIQNIDTSHIELQKLRDLGFNLALDDFGTGYSSLAYLSKLPINTLKIDKVFVQNIHKNEESCIIRSIVNLADNFNLSIIAEGVETSFHEEQLNKMGCHLGQGYYYSKAVGTEDFMQLCQSQKDFSNAKIMKNH